MCRIILFESISQNSANRFMVGDVKQSIYSFRQAMPDIFIRYKDKFPRYDREKDAYPASIVLDRNFRSRKTVTESVNFVFTQLMSRTCGGIDYVGDEKLAAGAQYPEKSGCETRVEFLEDIDGVGARGAGAATYRKNHLRADGKRLHRHGKRAGASHRISRFLHFAAQLQ